MIFWCISRHLDLNGRGGLVLPGRWHHAGTPVVYFAASAAGAMLEVCAHTSANDIPPSFTLLKISGPDTPCDEIKNSKLQSGWPDRAEVTRGLGSAWLKRGTHALLRVPSAIIPETFNYLLNPLHADAAHFKIRATFVFPFDSRVEAQGMSTAR